MKKLINHWMTGKTVSYSLRVLMILEKHRLLNVVTLFLYTGKYRKIYQKDFHWLPSVMFQPPEEIERLASYEYS